MDKINFTFVSFVYNHEEYIIEHLESIKYLIDTYGGGYSFNIIIGDDGSKDNSVKLVSLWLKLNENIFNKIEFIHDGVNRGFPVSFTNVTSRVESELFKCLAGDDVFSNENLFKDYKYLNNYECISAIPLLLIDNVISESRSSTFHMLASDVIFKNKPFIERFRRMCVSNSPSLIYDLKFIKNEKIINYIKSFKATEDLPMWIKVSQFYQHVKFTQLKKVHVYYRRTSGSIYLVANESFVNDKLKAYDDMLLNDMNIFERYLLKNRRFCFKYSNVKLLKLFNVNYYVYIFSVLKNICGILKDFTSVNIDIIEHQKHYDYIESKSKSFKNKFQC